MGSGKHACPGRTCGLAVPDALFCCYMHWRGLSSQVRAGISATAGMSALSRPRLAAIERALSEWREER